MSAETKREDQKFREVLEHLDWEKLKKVLKPLGSARKRIHRRLTPKTRHAV
jgi:hypothetical protein